jgi:uncharacterized protein YdhG (YjbR/CyaY superfamily)
LIELRKLIKETAKTAEEGISYGIPAYKLNGALCYFAGYKTHIGFYPTGSGIMAFEKQLAKYPTSKGTVRFELDKPLPLSLIKKIVLFRIKENSNKPLKKTNSKKS